MLRAWRTIFLGLLTLLAGVPSPAAADLGFRDSCKGKERITIAAVGDVLLHVPLQKQAYQKPEGFQDLWKEVSPFLKGADMAYANLEGPTAYAIGRGGRTVKDPGLKVDGAAYTGYPTFNYHPILVSELVRAGFTVVSTANNHAMDRASVGVDRTIETLRHANLPFMGTRTKTEAREDRGDFQWHIVTHVKGWNLAWIACTFSTNGIPDPNHQVLLCFDDEEQIEREIRSLRDDPSIDAIILTPHWGEVEYTQKVEKSQRALAQRFADAGATAMIGNHPHVTKSWEIIATSDGRESFVIYSIGNFVSAQDSLAKRTSALIYVGLSKEHGRKAVVSGVSYVPLYMQRSPYSVVVSDKHKNVPNASIRLLETLLGKENRIASDAMPRPGVVSCGNGQ